jgi:hypothetical protein
MKIVTACISKQVVNGDCSLGIILTQRKMNETCHVQEKTSACLHGHIQQPSLRSLDIMFVAAVRLAITNFHL